MADVSYMIDIQAQTNADEAAQSVTALESAMKREIAQCSALDAAQRKLNSGTSVSIASMASLKAAREASKARLEELTTAYARAIENAPAVAAAEAKEAAERAKVTAAAKAEAQAVEKVAVAQKHAAAAVKQHSAAAAPSATSGGSPGKIKEGATLATFLLRRMGSSALASGEQLEQLGSKGKAIMKIVLVAKLAAAAIKAVVGIGKSVFDLGVKASKAALGVLELQQADAITFEALTGSEKAGAALGKMVGGLADKYGVAGKEVGGYAAKLIKAGVRGKDLASSLKGLAIQQAATGDADVDGYIESLKNGDTTAKKFAATQERIFGVAAGKRGQTLEAGIDRIKRKFGELLASPAMSKGLSTAFGAIEKFINSPAAADAMGKVTGAIGSALEKIPGLIETAASAVPALASAFSTVAGAVTGVLDVVTSVAAGIAKLPGLLSDTTAVGAAKNVIESGGQRDDFGTLIDAYKQAGLSSGAALSMGTAEGIAATKAAAAAAATDMASTVVAAAKTALEIHSPSRVFARLGMQTAEGFGQGLAANDGPQQAVRAMVQAPAPRPAQGGGRSITISIGDIIGVKDGQHAADLIEARLTELLEAVA